MWDGKDRRKPEATPPEAAQTEETLLLRFLIKQFHATNSKLAQIHDDMVGNKEDMNRLRSDVETIKLAFPKNGDGGRDYVGHHDHHEHLIKTSKRWADIFNDVLKKLFSGTAWIVIVFVAVAILKEAKVRLGMLS